MIENLNGCRTGATNNQLPPSEGPKVLMIPLDFTGVDKTINFDYSNVQAQGYMAMVQGIYFDNSVNGSAVTVTVQSTLHAVTCPANSQGFFPLFVQNPLVLQFVSQGNVAMKCWLTNFPIPAAAWHT